MTRSSTRPGAVVAWWRGSALAFAVHAGEEKQRISLVGPGGREDRVPEARLAFEVEPPGRVPAKSLADRKAAGERASRVEEEARRAAEGIDVAVVWELLRDAGIVPEEAIAELSLGSRDGAAKAATVVALLDDGIRFVRKADGWEARAEEAVEEIVEQRRKTEARAEAKGRALGALARAGAGEGFAPSGEEVERRYLAALESVALLGDEAQARDREAAAEALEASGIPFERPWEGAFLLLRRTGRFEDDDHAIEIDRHALRVPFPDEVLEAADRAARRGFDRDGRDDRTALLPLTIDDPSTSEVDDALTAQLLPGNVVRIAVHIADPGAFVAPGDAVDVEALRRGTTYYFPDRKIPMLPPSISEGAASLVAGEDRPALSFVAEIGETGEILAWEVARTIVRVARRLDYDEADAALAAGDPALALLDRAAQARARWRAAAGAIRMRSVETEIRVGADRLPRLSRRDTGTPAHRLVSEAMVLAGELAARFCVERAIPAIYRRQSPPDGRLPELAGVVEDPRLVRAIRRQLRRGEGGLVPGPHFALGLPSYAQATSPLRRFQDLAVHRQIASALLSAPPPYDAEALQRVAATTERAEIDARRAERTRDRYWLLRWLAAREGEVFEGVLVDLDPRPIVILDATATEEVVPGLTGVPGDRVRVRVTHVNPRADLVRLRPE